jgi:hypothetical protein
MVRGGRAEAPVPRSDVSFRLDQKTGNFKAAIFTRPMQWSVLTEGKQKNELAQTQFRFIKILIIITLLAVLTIAINVQSILCRVIAGNAAARRAFVKY